MGRFLDLRTCFAEEEEHAFEYGGIDAGRVAECDRERVSRQEAQPEALPGPVGTGGKVGDAQVLDRRREQGAWRSHAVQQREDLELGLELIGHCVDDQVCIAGSILDAVRIARGPLGTGGLHAGGSTA